MKEPVSLTEEEEYELTRQMDIVHTAVFMGQNAAFLGSLMCSLTLMWTRGIPTAATDGKFQYWNPEYFLSLPPKSRVTEKLHELWHDGFMHHARRGDRNPHMWNVACDIKIDLMLEELGFTFDKIPTVLKWWKDGDVRRYIGWMEEDIYNDIIKDMSSPPTNYVPDLQPITDPKLIQEVINNVIRAVQQSKMSGHAGNLPGCAEEIISNFLRPIIPWERHLKRWMEDLQDSRYTLKRPNRRYENEIMASLEDDFGALSHLGFIFDVSGSVNDDQERRFASEFAHVKRRFRPKKISLVQFDTIIQDVKEYGPDDEFDKVDIKGRGGTSLVPVKGWIEQNKPKAAIIFSDLHCAPMEPLLVNIPVLWVAIDNHSATVPFGKLIHIGT